MRRSLELRPRTARSLAATLLLTLLALLIASQVFGGPIRYVIVSGHSMEPLLHTGDLAIVLPRETYRHGDVVAFRVPEGEPGAGALVIHRVVGGTARNGYLTQGDNRDGRDPWRPKAGDVNGAMAFHVPKVGLVPGFLGTPLGLALATALLAFLAVAGGGRHSRGTLEPETELVVADEAPLEIERLGPAIPWPAASPKHSPAPAAVCALLGVGALCLVAAAGRRARRA